MRKSPPTVPPSAAQRHEASGPKAQGRQFAPQFTTEAAPAAARPRETAAGHHPPHRSPRTSHRTPSPPWQCSGSVERCATRAQHSLAQSGAGLLPGPSRSTAARDATEHAVVAPSSAASSHALLPARVHHKKAHAQERGTLEIDALLLLLNGYIILKE